jgi:aryl-alcohol dehydrogenase-like predicted oxidoreductase
LAVVDRLSALARGDDVSPIPGTKRTRNLEENAAAVAVQLSTADLARVEEIAPKGVAAGARSNDPITVGPR